MNENGSKSPKIVTEMKQIETKSTAIHHNYSK